ncbi:MAG: glycosyltransferase family 2 protein [Phycisphaerales bacterium]|nr:glycosyltransferase family 2 protein [Phycisphaerales bacterium]
MISVVVPIFNESENLPELRRRLQESLDPIGRPWEVLFVNDGSKDDSARVIADYHQHDARFKLIDLSRNFGHQPAVTAGIHHASGDCVILMDGDLQDPPEIIPQLIEQWAGGFQVVLAERRTRGDRHGARGLGYRLFYPMLRWMTDLSSAPDAGIFGLMDRAVVDQFNRLPERNRFIPGLRSWLGFRQTRILYDRQDRAAGQPKQTLRKLIHYGMDAMISFSYKPLRAATYLGFVVSIVAFLLGVYFLFSFFYFHKPSGSGFTTTILCVLFLGGVQLICTGILGEYIGRMYEEIKQRPLYIVQRSLGVENPPRFNEATAPASSPSRH